MDEKNYEHTPGTIEDTAETAEAVTEAAEETACAAASETVAEAADAPEIKAADLAEEIRREAAEPADTASQAGIYGYDPLREEQKANTMREFSSQQTKTAQERWREEAQQYSWRSSHKDSDGLKNSERETFNPRTGMYEAPGAAASAGANRTAAQESATTADNTSRYTYTPQTGAAGATAPKEKKEKSAPGYITRRAFILGLICCMLATSGLTLGGLALTGNLGGDRGGSEPVSQETAANEDTTSTGEENSATNYSLVDATGAAKTIGEIVSMNENAVVEIQTEAKVTDSWLQSYVTTGAGSGVIVQEDGYILTCNHVIKDATSITVILKDGTSYPATLIGGDELTDVAVVKIDATGLTAATYGNSDELAVGDLAVAIGNPLGELGGTATSGIISALNRQLNVDGKIMNLLQTDTSINPGNSGGGLFNDEGNLIGLVVAKSSGSDVEGLGFAIPINQAAEVAKELIENGKVTGRAAFGIGIIDLTDPARAAQYGLRTTGIYIGEVNSPEAKKAGFEKGDLLYYIDDQEITSEAVLRSILASHKAGDVVKVTVLRDNAKVELTATLIEATA
ncbi:MAG: trypsin-like peptidase domain-containing protein [Eubacterium sp.]|nr:trypsin-like peptidase domain-containing protein [Eubacterium sp.]